MDIPSLRATLVGHPNHDPYFLFGCFPLLLDAQNFVSTPTALPKQRPPNPNRQTMT